MNTIEILNHIALDFRRKVKLHLVSEAHMPIQTVFSLEESRVVVYVRELVILVFKHLQHHWTQETVGLDSVISKARPQISK